MLENIRRVGLRDFQGSDVELFQTLQNRGVRSRFVYYPNENHWVLNAQNSIHWYHTKRDWLKEFIGAGP